jgi:hypothetical protein
VGRCVIKAAKDRDLYCEWSSIVEAPTFIGTRAEITEYLARKSTAALTEQRLARADDCGTSLLGMVEYGDVDPSDLDGAWGDTGLIVEQRGFLRRDRMAAFLEAYAVDDVDTAYGLLDPFEDDEDDIPTAGEGQR